jgi:hypothetical protein
MRHLETLTEHQRRHLVHIYASLRDCIVDEVAYDREPDFPPLDTETETIIWREVYTQLSRLMAAAHFEEAARLEQELDDWYAEHVARTQALETQ